jgi:hypothetical protein
MGAEIMDNGAEGMPGNFNEGWKGGGQRPYRHGMATGFIWLTYCIPSL